MSKQELLDSGMEYLNEFLELDISTPYLVIGFSIVILIVNGIILYELSKVMHGQKGNYGFWSIFYCVLDIINFVVGFIFVNILVKSYRNARNKIIYHIAFSLAVLNPILFSLLLY